MTGRVLCWLNSLEQVMPQPLPTDRDLLLRLLDHIDGAAAIMSNLGDFLAKTVKQEKDLREACMNLTAELQVEKLSGWGVAPHDFAFRIQDLRDRLNDRLEPVRPYLRDRAEVRNPQSYELCDRLRRAESPEFALSFRTTMTGVYVAFLEDLVGQSEQIQDLKRDVTRVLEGVVVPDEGSADGPAEGNTFRWKQKVVSLSRKPFAVVNFLWQCRNIHRDGKTVRQASVDAIIHAVWDGEAGDRALPSAISHANNAFDSEAIPLRISRKEMTVMLIFSEP